MESFVLGKIAGTVLGWIINIILDPLKEYIEGLFAHRKLAKEAREIASSFDSYSRQYLRQKQYTIAQIGHIERHEVFEITNAWENGINGILLLGTAGSGKSGLVLDLAKGLHKDGIPVLFVRATDFALTADPTAAIKLLLPKSKDLGESLAILGQEQECVVIVDQIDFISESNSLIGFINLLKSIAEFKGVRILAVSRTYEANKVKIIKELGFQRIISRELDTDEARIYLHNLGISNPSDDIVELSKNLLNLSLISEIISNGSTILNIRGLAQLWEKYLLTIKEREGEQTFIRGMELADQNQIQGQQVFSLNWSQLFSTSKLISRGVIIQLPSSLLFRFRHEQLQTFLCAYSLFRDYPTPQKIVERYGKFSSKAILIWLCILYGSINTKHEANFVNTILNDDNLIPHYTQTSVLDQYIHLEILADKVDTVLVILETIKKHNNLRNYFFRNNPSAAWANYLWEGGFLSSPPEPMKTEQGYGLPQWDSQYYLIFVAPQVPEIVLRHALEIKGHGWYLARAIEALCKIPVEYSEKAVPIVLTWLTNPDTAELVQKETLLLIRNMATNEKIDIAVTLFDSLSAPRKENRVNRNINSYKKLFDYDEYDRTGAFEILKNKNPLALIQILERHLLSSLYGEEDDVDSSEAVKAAWWRNAVEDTDQDMLDQYKDYLLSALRDTLLEFIENDQNQGLDIVSRYLHERHVILRRLGLYIIGQFPRKFHEDVKRELLEEKNLDDTLIHHEFFFLLGRGYAELFESEKSSLIEMILAGPDLEENKRYYDTYLKDNYPDREKYLLNVEKKLDSR